MQYFPRRHVRRLAQKLRETSDLTFYGGMGVACAGLLDMTPANMSPFIYFQF
jgi:hypothetical protein